MEPKAGEMCVQRIRGVGYLVTLPIGLNCEEVFVETQTFKVGQWPKSQVVRMVSPEDIADAPVTLRFESLEEVNRLRSSFRLKPIYYGFDTTTHDDDTVAEGWLGG